MLPESAPEAPSLEIAHVLFMDIVAYSRLPMDRQLEAVRRLPEIVRGIPEYQEALAREDLLSLWTGDGMALVFFGKNFTDPPGYARRILAALMPDDGFGLRLGIHSGPVFRIHDINAKPNIAGEGINMAQRVMDRGDAGHILVSKSTADLLSPLNATWRSALHHLGEVEVKHGDEITIFNYYGAGFGNPEWPARVPGRPREPEVQPEIPGIQLQLWHWIAGVLTIITVLSLLVLGSIRLYHYAMDLWGKHQAKIAAEEKENAKAEADAAKRGVAAKTSYTVWLGDRAKKLSPKVLQVILANKCTDPPKTLSVAMRFEMPDHSGRWLTMGWWELKPGETLPPVIATQTPRIYYYYAAFSDGRRPSYFLGNEDNDAREADLAQSDFAYRTYQTIEGREPFKVKMRHWDFETLGLQELPLTCQQ